MLFKPLLAASSVAFAAFVTAEDSTTVSGTDPPTSSPTAVPKTISVKVGSPAELKFFPEEVFAEIGDTVQFEFYPKNHSVAQSSFDSPCKPLGSTGSFWSGFMPVNDSSSTFPTFNVTIRDKEPKWYYCGTGTHCQLGMVGVINPTSNQSLVDYRANAATVGVTVVPSGPPEGESGSGSESGTNETSTSSTPQPSGTSDSSNPTSTDSSGVGMVSARGWAVALAALAAGALVI